MASRQAEGGRGIHCQNVAPSPARRANNSSTGVTIPRLVIRPSNDFGTNTSDDTGVAETRKDGNLFQGRFGAWKYEVSNQDHSFAQGYECVNRLVRGGDQECEPTLNDPNAVNARRDN